jgi:RNA polymerase sigma-70 factor (ECF subfamily)
MSELFTEGEVKDSQLRMMFTCCHPSISPESQITLMLKTLCGLSVREISNAFLTNEETIGKRLYRTKEKIREEKISLDYPGIMAMEARTEAVLKTIYLLFNEGYNSSHPDKLIRQDLCEEALRLAILLSENSKTNLPQTNALIALMCYHASRFDSRIDDKGMMVLLKDQDRKNWNRFLIEKGNEYMTYAAKGEVYHDFHIEAGIASVHANANTFEDTDWKLILTFYTTLFERTKNPVVAMNRCLALAEVEGAEKAIEELLLLKDLSENPYYHASLGELFLKTGKKEEATAFFTKAVTLTDSKAVIELLQRKIKQCEMPE